jgi:hypothetical protein
MSTQLTNTKKSMPIKRQSSILGTCIFNFRFVLGAPPHILDTYRELKRATFAIPALTEYQVLACSGPDIQATCESSEKVLSFHAAMTDVSQNFSRDAECHILTIV